MPGEFLDAARELSNGRCIAKDEPRARTIAGRLYYASYLTIRDALRHQLGDARFKPASHRALSKALKGASDPGVAELGTRLDSLRKLRSDADYELTKAVGMTTAQLRVADATYIASNATKLAPKFPPVPRQ